MIAAKGRRRLRRQRAIAARQAPAILAGQMTLGRAVRAALAAGGAS